MVFAVLSCVIFTFILLMIMRVLLYRGHARFVVFTVVLLKIQVLWDVMLRYSPDDMLLYPGRFQSSDKDILNYVTTYKT